MDDKVIEKMAVITLGAIVLVYLSGCMVVAGTPEAIRAYGDYQVGTQKTAKEGNDSPNQYFELRGKSFWQKLTETEETPK